jgi:FtsP/CotA-like multicopper oxidase with cupredoxin domain
LHPAAAAAVLAVGAWTAPDAFAQLPGGTLDPATIPKYVDPLVIPPAMPPTATTKRLDFYEIAVRQFQQQILPTGMPMTTVWSYGSVTFPSTFNYPAFTIEAKVEKAVRVKWINGLVDASGNYLPHLLPVDQTLHWANPPGGTEGRDGLSTDPTPYTGPVPMIAHLHGGHSNEDSDGFPEAWFLPAANDIPSGYATVGSYYDRFRAQAERRIHQKWDPGTAVFQYENDQPAATLWYHDHTLGMTRTNVYAGPAGFYLLRGGPTDAVGGVLPGPAPKVGDPAGTRYFEIPIAIQDRSFNADGSLFYPDSRTFFDGFTGPFIPDTTLGGAISDISPIWNPEFFGNTMVVNGKTWPFLEVEARRYRFRFLNGSQSRFLILTTDLAVPMWQIGADGGFLPAPELRAEILLGPAERSDTIVDFTNVPVNTTVTLVNLGPDEPFGGGVPGVDFPISDPNTTGQVMQFRVVAATGDPSTPAGELVLPAPAPLPAATNVRQVSLNELDSATVCVNPTLRELSCAVPGALPFGPQSATLGTVMFDAATGTWMGMPMMWTEPISENPALGATETWEIFNFTVDAHPIHIHEVQFQIVNREVIGSGAPRGPDPGESGRKDTVIAYPGEITRVRATYDQAGLFVWHCHILEHEDNEMMRPYRIGP